MSKPTKFDTYNAKQVQITQIKCTEGTLEHKALVKAVAKLKRVKGYSDTKAVFVSSVLEAADNVEKKSTKFQTCQYARR